jgi:hypothetical protein
MRYSEVRQTAVDLLTKAFVWETNATLECLWATLAQQGKMTTEEITNYAVSPGSLSDASDDVLCLLYQALWREGWPGTSVLFNEEAISNAERRRVQKLQEAYPLKFHAIRLSAHDEYLFALTAQEINALVQSGVLQIRTDMQRESVITSYHGQLISHVRYDDEWAQTISAAYNSGDGYSSALRWNLVVDGTERYEYDDVTNELVIYSGSIAIIGGQHRTRALEYALYTNPNLDLKMGIFLTVAGPERAQFIINQDETRLEINKEYKKSLEDSASRRIVRLLQASEKMRDYKFVATEMEYRAGGGFVVISHLMKAIEQDPVIRRNVVSAKKIRNYYERLADFFEELEEYIGDEMANWRTTGKAVVCPNAFYAYIWLAYELWKNENVNYDIGLIISEFKKIITTKENLRPCGGKGHIATYLTAMKEAFAIVQ